jgi:hypothetical protein
MSWAMIKSPVPNCECPQMASSFLSVPILIAPLHFMWGFACYIWGKQLAHLEWWHTSFHLSLHAARAAGGPAETTPARNSHQHGTTKMQQCREKIKICVRRVTTAPKLYAPGQNAQIRPHGKGRTRSRLSIRRDYDRPSAPASGLCSNSNP